LNIAWEHKNQGMVGDVVSQKKEDVGGRVVNLIAEVKTQVCLRFAHMDSYVAKRIVIKMHLPKTQNFKNCGLRGGKDSNTFKVCFASLSGLNSFPS